MKLAAALLLAALAGLAQDMPEVRGTVVEYSTNSPIAGAEVILYEFVTIDNVYTRKPIATIVTDLRGAFTLKPEHPGNYFAEAKKPMYLQAEELDALGPIPATHLAETRLTVTRQPVPDIHFILIRSGGLTGRVVDADEKPVAGFTVTTGPPGSLANFNANAVTGPDGVFTFPRLVPSRRTVHVAPADGSIVTVISPFTEEDRKLVKEDIETSDWPSVPIDLIPGAMVDVGTIRLRKVPYYRARLIYSGECPDGESWLVAPEQMAGYTSMKCAAETLLGNLTPGPHTLAIWTRGAKANDVKSWAVLSFTIGSENVDLPLTFTPSTEVQGRVVNASGNKLPELGQTRVLLGPVELKFTLSPPPVEIMPQGNFTIGSVAWPRHQIYFPYVPPNIAIKEFRYGGQPVPDGVITIAPGAQLEVVIDDQPATVAGSTSAGAQVYLAKWPLVLSDVGVPPFSYMRRADAVGKFQFASLAAGEFRLLAVTADDSLKLADVALLERLLTSAQKVTVERGGQQAVEVKLSDPAR